MNLPVNQNHRRAWLLATTMFFGALAIPAGAYVLRDTDPRMEEITAALPDTKASATAVAKPINVEDVKDLVVAKAAAHGVPTELARAVVQVESDYDARTTGSVGEVGLMQIKYETARILGYTGTLWDLYDPETNIEWGMRYLAGARRLADGDLCGTVMRYNGGHGLKRMSRATTIYCNKVKRVLGLPPDPVPVADARDDQRKDALEKKQDDRAAAKREKAPVKLAAAAERKTEAAAKNEKTNAKIDAKTSVKTAERRPDANKQNTKTPDTKTAQANRDKPADRKVATAEVKTAAAAAKHSKVVELKQETTAKKSKIVEPAGNKTAVSAAAKHPKAAEAKQQTATKNGKLVEPTDKKITVAAAAKQPKVPEPKQQTAAKNTKLVEPADKKTAVAAAAKQPKVAEAKQEAPAKHTKPAEPAAKGTAATTAQASPAPVKSARKHDRKLDQSAVNHAGATQTTQADLMQAGASATPVEPRIRIADHRVSE